MNPKNYLNNTPLMDLHGVPIYMHDMVEACLRGRLNLFLQGDTGSGKTQLAKDTMAEFGDKSLFILGRNDMDTRELFQQINLEALRNAKSTKDIKELTDRVNTHLIVVDELPNCVPAVRAQLFNLFDGFVEINGKAYPIGNGYSLGIATGNIGQRFTESANELGRALRDRMHVTIDTDYFAPSPHDTLNILNGNTNPRVEFEANPQDNSAKIIESHKKLVEQPVSFEKLLVANYLLHGLDYCTVGGEDASKRKMKDAWPNNVGNHGTGSDEALVLPVSPRAAKSVIRLSQALDSIAQEKGASIDAERGYLDSMLQAYKFVGAYSGILNDAKVDEVYGGDKYKALDAIVLTTRTQFDQQKDNIVAGIDMVRSGKTNKTLLDRFNGRWGFMKDTLEGLIKDGQNSNS